MDLKEKLGARTTRPSRYYTSRTAERPAYSSSETEGDISAYEYIEDKQHKKPYTLDRVGKIEGRKKGEKRSVTAANPPPSLDCKLSAAAAGQYNCVNGSIGEFAVPIPLLSPSRLHLHLPAPCILDRRPNQQLQLQTLRHGAGLSDTPSSSSSSVDNNCSDATLTDTELALTRDSTILVQHQQHQPNSLNFQSGFVDNLNEHYPPNVPPRNTSMGRANARGNSHSQSGGPHGGPPDRETDFEPSCLVRTPSGSVFIPTDLPKNSSPTLKTSSPCHSPVKGDSLKSKSDRCQLPYPNTVPVLPVRNNLRRPNSTHFSHSRFHIRKNFPYRCSWKCTAITFIFLTLLLSAALAYFAAMSMLKWQYEAGSACAVVVEDNELVIAATEVNSTYPLPSFPKGNHRHLGQSPAADSSSPHSLSSLISNGMPGSETHISKSKRSVERDDPPSPPMTKVFLEMLEGEDGNEGSGNVPLEFGEQHDSPAVPQENDIPPFVDADVNGDEVIPDVSASRSVGSMARNAVKSTEILQHKSADQVEMATETPTEHKEDPMVIFVSHEAGSTLLAVATKESKSERDSPVAVVVPLVEGKWVGNEIPKYHPPLANSSPPLSSSSSPSSLSGLESKLHDTEEPLANTSPLSTTTTSPKGDPSISTSTTSLPFRDNLAKICLCSCPCTAVHTNLDSSLKKSASYILTENNASMISGFPENPIPTPSNSSSESEIPAVRSESSASSESSESSDSLSLLPNTTTTNTTNSSLPSPPTPGPSSDVNETDNTTTGITGGWVSQLPLDTKALDLNLSIGVENDSRPLQSVGNEESTLQPEWTTVSSTADSSTTATRTSSTALLTDDTRSNTTSTPTTSTTTSGSVATPVFSIDTSLEEVTPLTTSGSTAEGPTFFPSKTLPPDRTTFLEVKQTKRISNEISPYDHWNVQFHQRQTAFVRFNYTIEREASIGVYGRKNAFPTHTQYDFAEILNNEDGRSKRSAKDTINVGFVQYLESGQWYVAMYNDDGHRTDIEVVIVDAGDISLLCPYDCHGHGICVKGTCECFPGYIGTDCSQSICPVLCSGNGEYLNGGCQCKPGWKGRECNLRHEECEVPGCSGHGHCIEGKCRCVRGYKGEFCEQVDCLDPECSGHGACADGVCICRKGWRGDDCNHVDDDVRKCLPDCSGHGVYDLEKQQCLCDSKWTGQDCSKELCDMDCGPYGKCEAGRCQCQTGWTGPKCDIKSCDPRCLEHGQCKNGTCICVQGWNGKHCTLDGCPYSCRNHGDCERNNLGEWYCRCHNDWDGEDCSIPLERICNDNRDNDNDGLVDCADSECCSAKFCSENLMCVSTSDPLDVLLRKQPPAVTASFFQRMRFLIEEDSVQNYARKNAFNESRASVIRGRVVSPSGNGVIGIRVSTTNTQEGFTLTRDTGWFDLMVNGGGAVTLQFQRNPFKLRKKTVMVPWNEVIVIDTVIMSVQEDSDFELPLDPCPEHNYDLMKPVVLATWRHEFQGGCPEKSTILAESQVVQESLPIPGSNLHLVYHSSRAGGYMSTLQLQLTPDVIPKSLRLIHLRISIEGSLFEKVFEADPKIKFTYAWNRRNVYRQRVYGVTTATVSVGYEYNSCHDIIWDRQTTKLSGHDMSISEIGGWNLDIHHRYNFHEGILQKGDGTNIYLRYRPNVLLSTMGDGEQRAMDCPFCNGPANEQRLLAPVALAAAQDGSLYVGDFNLVRRILPDKTVQTVVELNPSKVSYRYHLTVSPTDGTVYISDPERHQILKIKSIEDTTDPKNNFIVAIGNGDRCLPGDKNNCGDGGPATAARLVYPKGIVLSADNKMYFADGTTIRVVDKNGIIRTLIGDHRHKSHWKPIPCQGTLSLNEVHLRWPTELAISPLDNSLHIIDDHMVLRLTQDGRIKVVAGQPLHCPTQTVNGQNDADLAIHSTLVFPETITFSPSGDLYIAESDSQRINRIRVIGTDGKISNFAGIESKCNCLERDCKCYDDDHFLAATSKLNTISSIAVTPDNILHIADQGNLRVRSVTSSLPENNKMREYEIYSPETQEIYVFNRFGQHIATKNILTGNTMYTFAYNVNTSYGKLSTVTDAAGNKIYILRDYSNQVNSIENTQGQKCRLTMSRMRMLQDFITPDYFKTTFDYHSSTGLLKSKRDSAGQSFLYLYDENGRLTEAVMPSGEVIKLTFDLSIKGATVKITRDEEHPLYMVIKGSSVTTKTGNAEDRSIIHPDGSVSSYTPWNHNTVMETVTYPVLEDTDPVIGESFPVPARQKTMIHDDQVHRLEWRYFLRKEGKGRNKQVTLVQRKMRVNGDNLLAVEYDRDTSTEVLYDQKQSPLLTVRYDTLGRALQWIPSANVTHVDLKYDRFGRLSQWQRGDLSEQYGFDRQGRLAEIRYADGAMIVYTFADLITTLPTEIMVPSGRKYQLQYDESNSLQAVVTPGGVRHEFATQTTLGFYKLTYLAPGTLHPFVLIYNDRGLLLEKTYPELWGHVSYAYDEDGRLAAILSGDTKSEFSYYSESGLVKSIVTSSSSVDSRIDYKYHGGLKKEEKIRYGSKLGLENAKTKYQYDGYAHLQRVETEVNGKNLPPLNFTYNPNTGLLEGVLHLRLAYYKVNETLMEDNEKQFSLLRMMDPYNRDIMTVMTVQKKEVFRLETTHDSRNRVRNSKMKIGDKNNPVASSYSYNIDSYLEEVVGPETWKYNYDENGNILFFTRGTAEVRIQYNETDRLASYGKDKIAFDHRGFLVQKGDTKFQFNAKAQIVLAQGRNQYEVRFFYDAHDRLIAILDHLSNLTQYFYTNPMLPNHVTLVHYPRLVHSYQLIYDDRGFLIYFQHGETKHYVATDYMGTPVAVFNQKGDLLKEVQRSPFGQMIKDTNPGLFIPVDFHGGLKEPITGLVHFGSRVYDPSIGQWLTSDWENILDYLAKPYDMHLYRFKRNDPVNPQSLTVNIQYLSELSQWLPIFGYKLENLMGIPPPAFDTPNHKVSIPPSLPVTPGLHCATALVQAELQRLNFVPKTRVKVENNFVHFQPRVSHRKEVFGEGILISRVGQRATVHVIEGASQVVQDVVTSVLNNSYFLDLHFTGHGQDMFHFVKDNTAKFHDDRTQLERLGAMFNISLHESEHGKDIKLHTKGAIVNIHYGSTVEQERHRLMKHARKRAVDLAWEHERELLHSGQRSLHDWTDNEREQLVGSGIVTGYYGEDIYEVNKYPFLNNDPTNIAFKKESKRHRRKGRRNPK